MTDERLLVSILTPVFNESGNLRVYHTTLTEFMDTRPEYDFEIVFVDDGSSDDSWRIIQKIAGQDTRFSGIRLSRNRGAHIALTAAVDAAKGDLLMTLACDLQDPVETFDAFVEKWRQGAKIVWGKGTSRVDAGWRKISSELFHTILKKFAMPKNSKFTTGSFFLIDKVIANNFKQFREQNRITFAIVAWTGFEQSQVEYERRKRMTGSSGWTIIKLFRTVMDALLGYSTIPLRCITGLGIFFFFFSMLFLVYLVFYWFSGTKVPGWTSIMFMFSFFSGIQCLLIGILGEYLKRIYSEVLARPLYFISESTDGTQPKQDTP